MKKSFQTRIEAINWIAATVENEGQFEVIREQLTFNYIYTKTYFLHIDEKELQAEVLLLGQK
ncbi:MAG: hypothetical protein HKN16_13855 [Saprospiraceae bacterium]|nr:hypothetical protein [Saprospiraceae bacterium]